MMNETIEKLVDLWILWQSHEIHMSDWLCACYDAECEPNEIEEIALESDAYKNSWLY